MNSVPIAVLISDIHFNINTVYIAKQALDQAVYKANSLNVPLIVAGDIHDTKANLRAECVDAINNSLDLLNKAPIVLVGNHDKINEKSFNNALGFMHEAYIIDKPQELYRNTGVFLIPYLTDQNEFYRAVDNCWNKIIIAHQGLVNSNMGDYIQDKTAVSREMLPGLRIISGHYHQRQKIELPIAGSWDYIGNPYTLSFGEANDPPKGFQILHDDGSLQFVPTNLRKHVIIEHKAKEEVFLRRDLQIGDLIWVKISGTRDQLIKYKKSYVENLFELEKYNFKLTLYPTDLEVNAQSNSNLTQYELLDNIIDSTDVPNKPELKSLWKTLCE